MMTRDLDNQLLNTMGSDYQLVTTFDAHTKWGDDKIDVFKLID